MTRDELTTLEHRGIITPLEAEAIYLHDIKGMSYLAIALAKGRARQTIHERARRGHEKIRAARKEAAYPPCSLTIPTQSVATAVQPPAGLRQ